MFNLKWDTHCRDNCRDHPPIQVISVPVNLLYMSIYRDKGRRNTRGCLMNQIKLTSYPGNFLARWWIERMTGFKQNHMLLRISYLLLWHCLYYWTEYFQTFAFLHSSISKHVSMDAVLSEETGLILLHFIYPYFFSIPPPCCTSQNNSSLVKVLSCSLLSCFHQRNVLPHSPLTPFLTEAFSLFLHTAYILSDFSHFSSSVLKNPTQSLLLNHLLILVCLSKSQTLTTGIP